ncbi:hypothetical protein GALMADRAFT_144380 [Galerina marginata CBS 339.88]|uniref:CxC2-like cysteine cluster KDZ transposase-associated domain-containing protein n=1 Tax=Galerina marginata (strain CBS 339.88) TaxID=685588 RepID=A0A067SIZ6_GALM3|nr:hypothetical protein GALMADRAFT_144380 [Galerina marginata CBS 339.88]
MSESRPSKRQRAEGGSYHDTVPIIDDYYTIHAREAEFRRVGNSYRLAPALERSPQLDPIWATTESWAPVDDPEFSLDPDGAWYDEQVGADVMEEFDIPSVIAPPKKKRSRVAKRPHVVWKELHRETYLEEVVRWSGRGDFINARQCSDCILRKAEFPALPEYRCQECFLPDLVCASCCVRRHKAQPLHRIAKWTGVKFTPISLKDMGLKVQLNHASLFCSNPIPCHTAFLLLHTNGIHQISIQYCGCTRAIPHHLQLLRRGFYPATQLIIKTCVTFSLLRLLHKFALTTKASTYDFYRALEKMTDSTGLAVPDSRYRAFFRTILQWRHLQMLKWGARAHDELGAEATGIGELAVVCPSCPRPGVNLPVGWEDEPVGTQYLYMMFVCMDANFRLKNQVVSNYSQDPGLGTGWSYMIPREPYKRYVLSRANDEDISISTCVGLQALAKAYTKYSQGLRHTGVGGSFCGRSEMVLPVAIGNLQKGERYANMDYVFGSSLRSVLLLPFILISYDIASTTQLIPAIPKLHEPMHGTANHQVYSLNFIPGVGASDLETPERIWSAHNPLGNSTKTQGPGSRQDVLDDHFGFWNWCKYIGLGSTLMRRYKRAVADRNIQAEGHRGLTESLDADLVASWEELCVEWEADTFPKTKTNPYQTDNSTLTEAQVRKDLADEEEERLVRGGSSVHATSASSFVVLGLELEAVQRRIRRLVKVTPAGSTARQLSGLTEQRNLLRTRMRGWERILPLYIPGLLQYQADISRLGSRTPSSPSSNHPEDAAIWLPSNIPAPHREMICGPGLVTIEKRLRVSQAHDALENVRHVLKIKSRMVSFKNKNIRGQREGTRSRTVIDRVHENARIAAEKYRASRLAILKLSGPGDWEKMLQPLEDGDIRSYQDPNRLRQRQGRLGTLEDDQVLALEREGAAIEEPGGNEADINLLHVRRGRRDGTGETRRTLSWIWTSNSAGDDDQYFLFPHLFREEWLNSTGILWNGCGIHWNGCGFLWNAKANSSGILFCHSTEWNPVVESSSGMT